MVKILIAIAAIFGTYMALVKFFPQFFKQGFMVSGYSISYAVIAIAIMAYLVYKVKA